MAEPEDMEELAAEFALGSLPQEERQEADIEIARAPTKDDGVERDEDGFAADRFGAPDETFDYGVGFAPIELEETRAVAIGFRDFFHRK